jgi:hypothetical protein
MKAALIRHVDASQGHCLSQVSLRLASPLSGFPGIPLSCALRQPSGEISKCVKRQTARGE